MSSLESFLCLSLLPVLNMSVVHEAQARLKHDLSQSNQNPRDLRRFQAPATGINERHGHGMDMTWVMQ